MNPEYTMLQQQTMGDVFDGATDRNGLMAYMIATKTDSLWKGIGVGTALGLALAGAGIWFLRK